MRLLTIFVICLLPPSALLAQEWELGKSAGYGGKAVAGPRGWVHSFVSLAGIGAAF